LLVACGGDDEEGEELPEVDCSVGAVPVYSEVSAIDKCVLCHSSELSGSARNDAPDDDNFDTYEGAAEHADEMAHEVFEGEMPPSDSGITISDSEKEELYRWALCGAPES